jgi:hypothetical protein
MIYRRPRVHITAQMPCTKILSEILCTQEAEGPKDLYQDTRQNAIMTSAAVGSIVAIGGGWLGQWCGVVKGQF